MQEIEGKNPEARKLEEKARKLESRAKNPGITDYLLSIKDYFDMEWHKRCLNTDAMGLYERALQMYQSSGEWEKAAQICERMYVGGYMIRGGTDIQERYYGRTGSQRCIKMIERVYSAAGKSHETVNAVKQMRVNEVFPNRIRTDEFGKIWTERLKGAESFSRMLSPRKVEERSDEKSRRGNRLLIQTRILNIFH